MPITFKRPRYRFDLVIMRRALVLLSLGNTHREAAKHLSSAFGISISHKTVGEWGRKFLDTGETL
jgi:hypothetical protein